MSISRRTLRQMRKMQAAEARELSRRDFMRAAGCAALSTTSLISTVWDLRMINAASADQLTSDPSFKAMVCIFLYGGNDANNLIVPTDGRWTDYSRIRGNLSLPLTPDINFPNQVPVIPIAVGNKPGETYGIHPTCKGLRNDANGVPTNTGLKVLYDEGKVAPLVNVGTLVVPTNITQYKAKSVPLPPQLFSHNDQQVQWQTSVPDKPSRTGWGGRCADLLYSLNGNNDVSMSISLSGANTFEVGNVINALNVSSGGAVSLTNITDPAQKTALQDILNMPHDNLYQSSFATICDRAIDSADTINTVIAATRDTGTTPPWKWNMPFLSTSLGNQLKMIARLIQAHQALGHSRQIYFASVGGYDLHAGQTNTDTTTGAHANLLNELSEGIFSFQRAIEQLDLADSVVTFTISDFCRTLQTNGLGSDHAWGNHQLIVGGSGPGGIVNGGNMYGTFPTFPTTTQTSSDYVGAGQWIPTTSVDQYSATLARWFGVSEGLLSTVFPNLGNFGTSNLGFMNLGAPAAPISTTPPRRPPSRTPVR